MNFHLIRLIATHFLLWLARLSIGRDGFSKLVYCLILFQIRLLTTGSSEEGNGIAG